MQMVLLLQNKHVVSSTYERGIYAVVIFIIIIIIRTLFIEGDT